MESHRRKRLSSSSSCSSSSSSYYGCASAHNHTSSTTGLEKFSKPDNYNLRQSEPLTLFDDVKLILHRHDKKLYKLEANINFMVGWLNNKFGFLLRQESTSSIQSELDAFEENTLDDGLDYSFVPETGASESCSVDHPEDVANVEDQSDARLSSAASCEHGCYRTGETEKLSLSSDLAGKAKDETTSLFPRVSYVNPQTPLRKVAERRPQQRAPPSGTHLPSQCDICGKFLKDPSSLRQHKQIHMNVRPFVCSEPTCGKSFRRKFHLQTHMLIHVGVKKHQCGYCGRLFLLEKDMISHERTHTGERPFQCPECPKSFNLKSHLVMHVRIHTGEKPYKCDICSKYFSQSNSLRLHKKKMHEEQMPGVSNVHPPKKKSASTKKRTQKTDKLVETRPGNPKISLLDSLPAKLPISRHHRPPPTHAIISGSNFPGSTLAILQPVSMHKTPVEYLQHLETGEHIVVPSSSFSNILSSTTMPVMTSAEVLEIPHTTTIADLQHTFM